MKTLTSGVLLLALVAMLTLAALSQSASNRHFSAMTMTTTQVLADIAQNTTNRVTTALEFQQRYSQDWQWGRSNGEKIGATHYFAHFLESPTADGRVLVRFVTMGPTNWASSKAMTIPPTNHFNRDSVIWSVHGWPTNSPADKEASIEVI